MECEGAMHVRHPNTTSKPQQYGGSGFKTLSCIQPCSERDFASTVFIKFADSQFGRHYGITTDLRGCDALYDVPSMMRLVVVKDNRTCTLPQSVPQFVAT